MSFENLGLKAELLRAVREQGYENPTPVQARAIPAVLEGRDILAGAQTGTGKTAGFTLPVLQRLGEGSKHHAPRALILTPTRELAGQVEQSVRAYGKYTRLRSTAVFGGVKIGPQISRLRRGVDLLVATPGRLLDLVDQRELDLSSVEILVLDEADRMLDMGFIAPIRRIVSLLAAKRQTLFFSATYSAEIRKLANQLLQSPEEIAVASENKAADRVQQRIHPVPAGRKRELLAELIGGGNWSQVLVFTRTKRGADRLSRQLVADGLTSTSIHGDKAQGARNRALADFKRGKARVLVATDVAARGLDIDQLPYVVNYDLPMVAEDYVHRIGRTGRAGNSGQAISFVSADERKLLEGIERMLKRQVERQVIPGYEPDFQMGKAPRTASRGKPTRPASRGKPGPAQRKPAAKRGNRSGAASDRGRQNARARSF